MLTQHRLSLAEAQRAIEKGVGEAAKDGKAMAFVVADANGDVICSLRMDGAHARVLKHAVRKAFTAATMQRDTLAFKADLRDRDGNLDEWGDQTLTTLQGGKAVRVAGEVVGAVAVGGNSLERDEEIARLAIEAIGL
jgi:uncharacterized protein GlcG (DUF336 family)